MTMLPHLNILHCFFRYEPVEGVLYWKERARQFFGSQQACDSWNARYAGKKFGSVDRQGYLRGSVDSRLYAAHRLIWKMSTGHEPDQIDHIDGNRLNNRIANLRSVTNADNCRNRGRRSDNTSGVVGVRLKRRGNSSKWHARIFVNGKDQSLGYFKDFDEAVVARREAEARYGFHDNHGKRQARPSPSSQEAAGAAGDALETEHCASVASPAAILRRSA